MINNQTTMNAINKEVQAVLGEFGVDEMQSPTFFNIAIDEVCIAIAENTNIEFTPEVIDYINTAITNYINIALNEVIMKNNQYTNNNNSLQDVNTCREDYAFINEALGVESYTIGVSIQEYELYNGWKIIRYSGSNICKVNIVGETREFGNMNDAIMFVKLAIKNN